MIIFSKKHICVVSIYIFYLNSLLFSNDLINWFNKSVLIFMQVFLFKIKKLIYFSLKNNNTQTVITF